jgi:hypothetical protein
MLRPLTFVLLMFTSMTALWGGWLLMQDPSGGLLKIPTTELKHSPFSNFLIPGILLFAFIGIGSLGCLIVYSLSSKMYRQLILLEGVALMIWIGVQMIMLQQQNWLHGIFLAIGASLIASSVSLSRKKNN